MAARLGDLEAVVAAKVAELSESSNKNVQLGARVCLSRCSKTSVSTDAQDHAICGMVSVTAKLAV